MPASILPSAEEVRAAYARIAPHVLRTPLLRDAALSAQLGGDVWLKMECAQHGGSFKLRGALYALFALPDEARRAGVVASSAGNHGIGIAMAAQQLGVPATIFVPRSVPAVKREKIAAYGSRIDDSQPSYDAAEDAAKSFARAQGATFVSPCTGRALLAGAGTVALEVFEQLPSTATFIVCVGGGGLVGGIGGFVRSAAPQVRVLGAQSIRTNAMTLALAAGHAVDVPDLPTLADGLAGRVDHEMYRQGKAALDAIATVEEADIADAIRYLHRAHGVVVEGSGAVGVAALRSGALRPEAFPAVVTISGGNIEPATLAALDLT
ncbi:MAG: pyridoxal-phosphate dependent enzyme [Gemmatimonadaceae bacterium]|nr:pyridoxal-phosphate dependent enzyme [Gemmatimonadaceae bacterium]MCW5826581.1 pyridoxal-phosphate dependent enzyme [Gemmatimonadaceae bacterium]